MGSRPGAPGRYSSSVWKKGATRTDGQIFMHISGFFLAHSSLFAKPRLGQVWFLSHRSEAGLGPQAGAAQGVDVLCL